MKTISTQAVAKLFLCIFVVITATSGLKAQNPFSSALEFNVFTEGDLSISGGDIEGAAAIGGNFIVGGNCQRTSNNATGGQAFVTIASKKYALVVAGNAVSQNYGTIFKVDGKNGALDDHFVSINSTDINTAAASGGIDIAKASTPASKFIRINATTQLPSSVANNTPLVNFAAAFTNFRAASNALASLASTSVTNASNGNVTVSLNSNVQNVWNINGNDINSFNSITLAGNLPSANCPLIINITGNATYFSWNNLALNINNESVIQKETNRAPYIVYNFINTENVAINQANTVFGSILAPNSNLILNSSANLAGQIVTKTITKGQAGEFHIAKFSGTVVSSALSADVLNMNATYNNNTVSLLWKTSNELNVARYEVERSFNGREFTFVSAVSPLKTSDNEKTYNTTDNIGYVTGNKIYYRLKIINTDGSFKYSPVNVVTTDDMMAVIAYPNPFIEAVALSVHTVKSANAVVRIINNSGNTVQTRKVVLQKGGNLVSITGLGKLPNGIYIAELVTEGLKLQKTIVKN